MPSVGPLELAIVLIIALVIFGPKKLPELGNSLGRGMREFKGSLTGDGSDSDDDRADREPKGVSSAKSVQAEEVEASEAAEARA